jgi:hypothetical protein
VTDLLLRLVAEDATEEAFGNAAGSVRRYAAALIDLGKEAAKAYADSERVQRQLKLAAGESAAALNEQAEALKRKFAVDDDHIRHLQVMLLRYGAAPSAIRGATEAILDYSAVTGKDATQATEMLIRGVESGTGSLGRMGVSFKATGDFSKDLASAVQALSEKFGGAGAEDAKSLSGRARSVGLAVDDLKKTFGAMFDEIDRRFHVLDTIATGLNRINQELQGKGLAHFLGLSRDSAMTEQQTEDLFYGSKATGQGSGAAGGASSALAAFRKQGAAYEPPLPIGGNGTEKTSSEKAKKLRDELEKHLNAENEYLDKKWLGLMEDLRKEQEHDDEILKSKEKVADFELDAMERLGKEKAKALLEEVRGQKKAADEIEGIIKDSNQRTLDLMRQQKAYFESAGMQLGQAFASALEAAMSGGTQSAEDIALDLTSSILTIAGGVIGEIAGEGDPYAAQAGSMLGHLAGEGIKAGVKSQRKHHDGAWIERYHTGGWMGYGPDEVPFIGQVGERVLSRDQVRNMGGPSAVDAMASGRGGGALHVHVSAIDTRSTREFFEGDGGRGFYNTLRTGRGQIAGLFGSRG